MVLHIGIDPFNGRAVIFNTIANTINKIDVVKVTSNDIENIDNMFLSIKGYLNEDVGNICACIDEKYGNDIRLEFLKKAGEHGFHNFEIIDFNTALFLHAVSHKTQIINSFWILWSKQCYIFMQDKEKTLFINSFPVSTKNEIDTVKKFEPPEALFLPLRHSQDDAKKLCSPNKFYYYSNFEIEIAALRKAKIMGTEKEFAANIISNFGRKCEILFNKKSLLTVLPEKLIPYEKVIQVEKKEGEDAFLKIIENDTNLKTFKCSKENLLFYINSNGIYYISEISEFDEPSGNLNKNHLPITKDINGQQTGSLDNSITTKEKPKLPTAPKSGFNTMLSNLCKSKEFQNYTDLIRQIGFLQTQLNIIQPLIDLKKFILSTEHIEFF